MNNFTSKFKKLLTVLILLTSFLDTAIPVLAVDNITSGPVLQTVNNQYGANLQSVVGATVNSNQTYATITTPGQASYLKWNSLNTAPGQTLDYAFLQNGATSINSVIGPSMSTFAGALVTSGVGAATSHVVISNPNGILLVNGAYFNCNAFTLTTQQINWETYQKAANELGMKNFNYGAYGKGGIQIGQGDMNNAVVMRVGELNVISPSGILIDGADIVAKDVRLITADGVTYVAAPGSPATSTTPVTSATLKVDASGAKATSASTFLAADGQTHTLHTPDTQGKSILVRNSAIAIKDNPNGRVYFLTKGNNDLTASIAALHSAIDGKIDLDVDGNADFQLIGNIDIHNTHVGGNLTTKTIDDTLTLVGSNTTTTDSSSSTLNQYMLDSGNYTTNTTYTYKWVHDDGNNNANHKPTSTPTSAGLSGGHGWNSVLDTTTITKTITTTDLAKVFPNATSYELDLMLSHLNDTYQSSSTTLAHNSNTNYSGKGSVAVTGNVTGDVIADGAGVSIVDLTAKSVNVTSTAGSTPVTASRHDTDTKTKTTSTHYWTTTGTKVVTTNVVDVAAHDEIKINGKWVDAVYHDWVFFDGHWGSYWTYGNNQSIAAWWPIGPDSRDVAATYKTATVAAAGNLNSSTPSVDTKTDIIVDKITPYNVSTITPGAITISGVTTTGGALTATAAEGITASGINVTGNASLTSNNSSVTLQGKTGFNGGVNSVSNNLSVAAKTDATVKDTRVTNELKALAANNIILGNTSAISLLAGKTLNTAGDDTDTANTKISIENGSSFGTARAFAADIDVKDSSIKSAGHFIANNEIKLNKSTVNNTYLSANDITLENQSTASQGSYLTAKNNITFKEKSSLLGGSIAQGKNVTFNDSQVGNSLVYATNDITLENGSKANKYGYLSAHNNLILTGKSSLNSAYAYGKNVYFNDSQVNNSEVYANSMTLDNGSSAINDSYLCGFSNINVVNNSLVNDSGLRSASDIMHVNPGVINVNTGAKISNSTAFANNIDVNNANIETSSLTATNALSVSNNSKLNNATLNGGSVAVENSNAKGSLNSIASNGALSLTNVQKLDNSAANATLTSNLGDISITNSTLGNTIANAANNITISGSTLGDTTANATGGTMSVLANTGRRSSLASLGSTAKTISIADSDITGSATLNATQNGVSISNSTLGSILNSSANTAFNIIGSTVYGNTMATARGGDLTATDSSLLGANVLTSDTGSVNASGLTAGTTQLIAHNAVSLIKSAAGKTNKITGNLTAHAGTTIDIKNTTVNNGDVDAIASSNGKITIDDLTTQLVEGYIGTATGSVLATTYGDIYVSDSTIKGDLIATSNESIASAVVDVDTVKSTKDLPRDVQKNISNSEYTNTHVTSKDITTTTTDTTTGRGNVTIERTTVGGNVDVDAKNIQITTLTANSLDAHSYATSTVETKQVDTTYNTTTTTYEKQKRGSDTNLGSTTGSYLGSGSHSTNTLASGGTISLSGITLANDVTKTSHGATTATNTLTANAASNLTANNITAGTTSLTSTGGSVSLTKGARTTNNSITGDLTAIAGTTIDISDSTVSGGAIVNSNGLLTVTNSEFNKTSGVSTLTSNHDGITIKDSTLGNTTANAHGTLSIQKDKKAGGSTLASLTSTSGAISIEDSTVTNAVDLTSNVGGISIDHSTLGSLGTTAKPSSAATTFEIKNGSTIKGDAIATSNGLLTVIGSDLNTTSGSSKLTSNHDGITITGSILGATTATASNGTLTVQKGEGNKGSRSSLTSLNGTAKTISISDSDITGANGLVATASGNKGISITNSTITKDANLTSNGDGISIEHSSFGSISNAHAKSSVNITKGSTVYGNTTAIADNGDITVSGSNLLGTNGLTSTKGDITITGSKLGDTNATATKGKLDINNHSNVGTLKANANEISIVDSTTGDVGLKATNDITIERSTIGNSIERVSGGKTGLEAGNKIDITDTTVKGNLVADAGNDITIKGLTTESVKRGPAGDVTLTSNGDIVIEAYKPHYGQTKNNHIVGSLSAKSLPTTHYGSTTRGDVTISDTTVDRGLTAEAKDINISDSNADNFNLTAYENTQPYYYSYYNQPKGGNITLSNVNTTGFSNPSILTAANTINIKNGSEFGTVKAFAADINIDDSSIGGGERSQLTASKNDVSIYGSDISNADVKATQGNIIVAASRSNSEKNNDHGPCLVSYKKDNDDNSKETKGSTITNSTLDAHNDIIISDSKVTNYFLPSIFNPSIKAGNNIEINGSEINNSYAFAGNSITVGASKTQSVEHTNARVKEDRKHNEHDTFNGSTITNSLLGAYNSITMSDSKVTNVMAGAGNDITIDKSLTKDVSLFAGRNIKVEDTLAKGYLNAQSFFGDVTLDQVHGNADAILFAGDDVNIKGSTLGDTDAIAGNDIIIKHSTVNGDAFADAGNDITINDLTVNSVKEKKHNYNTYSENPYNETELKRYS